MRAVIGNRSQKQVRRLIAIVDMLRQVIIDSTGAIERILESVNNTGRQLLQIIPAPDRTNWFFSYIILLNIFLF